MTDTAGQNFHSNSFAWTDSLDVSAGANGFEERLDAAGAPLPLIGNTDDEAGFDASTARDACETPPCGARWAVWPTAEVFDQIEPAHWSSTSCVDSQPGSFNFHSVGQSIAVWSDFNREADRPDRIDDQYRSPDALVLRKRTGLRRSGGDGRRFPVRACV